MQQSNSFLSSVKKWFECDTPVDPPVDPPFDPPVDPPVDLEPGEALEFEKNMKTPKTIIATNKELGKGAFGLVVKAYDKKEPEIEFAIKRINPHVLKG